MANAINKLDSFAALGDPTRRAIFERVAAKPSAVGELARGLPVSRPAVSQHLRILKEAGLVSETPNGTRRIYRLDPRGIAAMREWLDAHWSVALNAFKDFADKQSGPEVKTGEADMSIAPIVQTVQVKVAPARAFELFTAHMSDWWTKGKTIGKKPHVAFLIEPRAGGRWFERDADGAESNWGKVLAWEPPKRLLLGMQINSEFAFDPACETEVELTFTPADGGGTKVRLEHRNLDRVGADAAKMAGMLSGGWATHLAEFAQYAGAQA